MTAMMPNDRQMRAAAAEQAVEWFLEEHERPLETRESAALMAWYRASPINVAEFLSVAAIARDLHEAGPDPEHSIEALIRRARADDDGNVEPLFRWPLAGLGDLGLRRWQTVAVAIAVVGLGALSVSLLGNFKSIAPTATAESAPALHFVTRHGEQQTHRLADGSVLHLNTDSAVTVRYSSTQRQVLLTSGQAGFAVVHEAQRPFRVVAGAAEITDLGTTFDVRLRSNATLVTVVEGRVTIGLSETATGQTGASRQRPARLVELGPNQQASITRDEWPPIPTTIDAARTTAWLHRQIAFSREPLEQVAAELNRYAPKPIEILTPELRKLEITGVFSMDDTEEFVAFLRTFDGVRVEVTSTRILVSRK